MSGAIVAMGGGGFSEEPDNPLLDRFALGLARRERPRVCFVATASGDADSYVARFYRAFVEHDCRPADLGLFDRQVGDLRRFVLEQDVIYVGGGNTASLLAVWRAHGLDAILREALDAGAVLCGVSAGMNCWFEASVDRLVRPGARAAARRPGLRGGQRLPALRRRGAAPPALPPPGRGRPSRAGYAADDGVALHFAGAGALVEAVTSRERRPRLPRRARADGAAVERPLPTRYLG